METTNDAILVGGPRDGTTVVANGTGLLELTIDGMIHRYIHTSRQREHGGRQLRVYNYDGMVAPGGGRSGVETEPERLASPRAESGR